jgi:hypothetical protein
MSTRPPTRVGAGGRRSRRGGDRASGAAHRRRGAHSLPVVQVIRYGGQSMTGLAIAPGGKGAMPGGPTGSGGVWVGHSCRSGTGSSTSSLGRAIWATLGNWFDSRAQRPCSNVAPWRPGHGCHLSTARGANLKLRLATPPAVGALTTLRDSVGERRNTPYKINWTIPGQIGHITESPVT